MSGGLSSKAKLHYANVLSAGSSTLEQFKKHVDGALTFHVDINAKSYKKGLTLLVAVIDSLKETKHPFDGEDYIERKKVTLAKVNYLLQKGANINAWDGERRTPLEAAVASHELDLVKICVENGARINERNSMGLTALQASNGFEDAGIFDYLRAEDEFRDCFKEFARLCLEHSLEDMKSYVNRWWKGKVAFDRNVPGYAHQPLANAISSYNFRDNSLPEEHRIAAVQDKVNYLLELGADINMPDKYGWTPLKSALELKKLELVKLCVDNGADPTDQSYLYWAARCEDSAIFDYLCDKGATIEDHGQLLLNAVGFYNVDVVKTLLSKPGPGMLYETGEIAVPGTGYVPVNLLSNAFFVDEYDPLEGDDLDKKLECCRLLIEAGSTIEAKPLGIMMKDLSDKRRKFLDQFVAIVAKHGNPKQQAALITVGLIDRLYRETPKGNALTFGALLADSRLGPVLTPGDFV